MSVTVAVVVKDRRGAMARCLAALAAQERAPDELLVVDNGSTDGTLELLRATGGVRLVEQRGPLGAARQAAVEACRTDWLAFTDSDCRPSPGWLAALVDASDGHDVVQGRTVPAAPPDGRWSATQDISRFTDLYECCNLMYRTDALRRAGGFDRSTGFFGEDTAAGWRVRRLGGTAAYASGAVVAHDTTQPGAAWHLRRGLGYAAFPRLLAEFPEMRRELFWHGVLLRPRSLPVIVGTAGLLAAAVTRRPLPLLAAAPWAHARRS
ncbi:MAG: methyltransferase FkbM family, partial [Frankiales bacterium]|nr:methyltransferase FkbM family [Frankiales bacterium]